ncbi:helix-turn-helix transcriptional regulator [Sulfitobacter sp.]|uniref:helix-turn-helix transcriptional regulator n=1 Tax=Sulfitobacter sp. TaxID=1903071 RepID=UPI003FCD09A4
MPVIASLLTRQWSELDTSGSFDESKTTERISDLAKTTHGFHLTTRQVEVILLVLKGHSSTSIGLKLGITYETVKVFRRQVYRKCNISSQAELFSLIVPLISK